MQPHQKTAIRWILIGLTTTLIWGQSLLSRDLSTLQSESVQGLLGNLFGEWIYDTFLYQNIRKVAHFTEYALLGAQWHMLYHTSKVRNPLPLRIALIAGPIVACCDELLQFLSKRAPLATDVLLDCVGYGCGWVFILGVYALIHRRQKNNPK